MAETKSGLDVFALDEGANKHLTLTKEQIYTAIDSYLKTGNPPTDIDDGFITTLKEINEGEGIKLWIGTMAEYEALETKQDNVLYLFSDDPTVEDIEAAITTLQTNLNSSINSLEEQIDESMQDVNDRLDELGFKEGVAFFAYSGNPDEANVYVNSLTKEGKRTFFNFECSVVAPAEEEFNCDVNITIPQDFKNKTENQEVLILLGSTSGSLSPSPAYYNDFKFVEIDSTSKIHLNFHRDKPVYAEGQLPMKRSYYFKIFNAGWENV